MALINIWGDEEYHHVNEDPFSRKKKVMERISSHLAELDYSRSVTQIANKIKQLKTKYKQVLDNNRRSGRARMEWEYFDKVDAILGARPAINPPAGQVLDSNTVGVASGSRDRDDLSQSSELEDSTSQDSDDISMISEEDAEFTGNADPERPRQLFEADPFHDDPLDEEAEPAEPPVPAEPAPPANQGRVERQGKKVKETKSDKSINMMLKQFVDSQEAQDKRFVSMENQRAEDERKCAEREYRIRKDELTLAREQLQEQRRAREAREKRSDDMMQALLLSLTGQARVAQNQHVRQPFLHETYMQANIHAPMPSRSSHTPYQPYPTTHPRPICGQP